MNANGPKLSKSCINALIADGEISKEEVARRRDQLTASKSPAKVEVQSVAKADTAKVEAAKSKVGRLADTTTQMKRQPESSRDAAALTLTLDQQTFEALKHRGNYFVASIDDVVPTAADLTARAVAVGDTPRPANEMVPATAASNNVAAAETADDAVAPASAAIVPAIAEVEALAPGPRKEARPIEYPPGKMALGKKPSIELPPPPVEAITPPTPKQSSAETWLNYMKNRFEGGMNYEGVDANF